MAYEKNITNQRSVLIGVGKEDEQLYGTIRIAGKVKTPRDKTLSGICRFFEIDVPKREVHFDGMFFYGNTEQFLNFRNRPITDSELKQFRDKKAGINSKSDGYILIPFSQMELSPILYESVDNLANQAEVQLPNLTKPLSKSRGSYSSTNTFTKAFDYFPRALRDDASNKKYYFRGCSDSKKPEGKKINLPDLIVVETPLEIFPDWILEHLKSSA